MGNFLFRRNICRKKNGAKRKALSIGTIGAIKKKLLIMANTHTQIQIQFVFAV